MQFHELKSEEKEIRFGEDMRSLAVLNRGDHPVTCQAAGQRVVIKPGAQLMLSSCSCDRILVKCEQTSMIQVGFWPHPQQMWIIEELDEVSHARSKVKQDDSQDDEGIQYILKAKVTREKLVDLEPEEEEKETVFSKIRKKITGSKT